MTVLEVIQRSTEFLARKGVEPARLQAELLLAHQLRLPRMKLYLNFDRALTAAEVEGARELVRRRGTREPLQHIVGTVSFCGHELRVTPDVLIPRPETEQLAERAWQWLGQRQATLGRPPVVLDFGTGSGCLAIALALQRPEAEVHALDVSDPALAIARENAARHQVDGRLRFHAGDGLAALPDGLVFDLLVANPPYIPTAEIATLEPEVREHDPKLALDGGPDGLDCYRRLAAQAPARLRPEGWAMFEFGEGQGAALRGLFEPAGWRIEGIEKDDTGRDRFLVASRAPAYLA